MTYLEATEKAKQLFLELINAKENIAKKAEEQGRWETGLDSNSELFIAIDEEYKHKLDELWDSIDDWTGYNEDSD